VLRRWRKVGPLIKSFLGNTLHALAGMTDAPLMAFTLRRIRASAALMTPQPLRKFADKLLKVCECACFGAVNARVMSKCARVCCAHVCEGERGFMVGEGELHVCP